MLECIDDLVMRLMMSYLKGTAPVLYLHPALFS
jgi:hypothetical protein